MVKLTTLITFFTISIIPTLARDLPDMAIMAFRDGQTNKAIAILKDVTADSAQFKRSLEVLAKIYYQEQSFSHLFGITTFYRQRYLDNDNFSLDIGSLEVLALARLCQYDVTDKLLEILRKAKGESKNLVELIKSYRVAKEFGFKEERGVGKQGHLSQLSFSDWRINEKELSKLRDPYQLKIKVENKCKK